VAPNIEKALIGKVLDVNGGTSEMVYRGVLWAMQKGAHVISMSLGLDFPGHREKLKANYQCNDLVATSMALAGYRQNLRMFDKISQLTNPGKDELGGTIVVVATGNESRRPEYVIAAGPPGAAELFVSVGAVARAGNGSLDVAAFSNGGAQFAAPGEGIWSAKRGGGLVVMDGTSMATPHVAGVACLWVEHFLARKQPFQSSRVIKAMEANAKDLSDILGLDRYDVGAGLVQAPLS